MMQLLMLIILRFKEYDASGKIKVSVSSKLTSTQAIIPQFPYQFINMVQFGGFSSFQGGEILYKIL